MNLRGMNFKPAGQLSNGLFTLQGGQGYLGLAWLSSIISGVIVTFYCVPAGLLLSRRWLWTRQVRLVSIASFHILFFRWLFRKYGGCLDAIAAYRLAVAVGEQYGYFL